MDFSSEPLRCPKCNALVVDRRSPSCTTCHEALPREWVFTQEQTAKLEAINKGAEKEHAAAMEALDPANDPSTSEASIDSDIRTP